MITELELERTAAALDRAFREPETTDWTTVERLRLHADLLDRLAAAQRHWSGPVSRRAELVRDSAERMADELTNVTSSIDLDLPHQATTRR
ncbi:hypothetical protein [Saccharopolyspora hordei]|uniref:Uncharacterized protein n=1 Tax=Saccharopolyspora hordei TaxID=1838 RepID=A0A853ANH1_9PSEU|nr:hypothetical protein [Saccharopolyspora hordei]NYI81577.1 hypothetical protein [Saccharopolyspora hordei]